MKDINNLSYWKWDSRAELNRQIEADEYVNPHVTPWADAWKTSEGEEGGDELQDLWKKVTGYQW